MHPNAILAFSLLCTLINAHNGEDHNDDNRTPGPIKAAYSNLYADLASVASSNPSYSAIYEWFATQTGVPTPRINGQVASYRRALASQLNSAAVLGPSAYPDDGQLPPPPAFITAMPSGLQGPASSLFIADASVLIKDIPGLRDTRSSVRAAASNAFNNGGGFLGGSSDETETSSPVSTAVSTTEASVLSSTSAASASTLLSISSVSSAAASASASTSSSATSSTSRAGAGKLAPGPLVQTIALILSGRDPQGAWCAVGSAALTLGLAGLALM